MSEFRIRPHPDESDLRAIDPAIKHDGFDRDRPSRSWWDTGALIVNDDGVALIDADGEPHPFPPGGAVMVRTEEVGPGTISWTLHNLYLTDANGRVLVRLPVEGWADDELREFSGHAGLEFAERVVGMGNLNKELPGWSKAPNLSGAIHDQSWRDQRPGGRIRRMFTRR